jgi:DeoR/GlpR family transcriptional regulator of sugar metabolism
MNDEIPLARRALIASRLNQGHAVVAATLAIEFGVSEDAIRRDLRALAAEGTCRRVYGGALPLSGGATPMSSRIDKDQARKSALALAAVTLVHPAEMLFLDSGSTNLSLVQYLPEDYGLTIATNSIDIAAAVHRRADVHLIIVGGSVDPDVGGSVDASAVRSLAHLNIDRCFIGACAIAPVRGISAFGRADAIFKRAVLDASEKSIFLATNEKFSARAAHRVASMGEVDHWVVEHDISPANHAALSKACASVLKAKIPQD